jgi:hypothetical protein
MLKIHKICKLLQCYASLMCTCLLFPWLVCNAYLKMAWWHRWEIGLMAYAPTFWPMYLLPGLRACFWTYLPWFLALQLLSGLPTNLRTWFLTYAIESELRLWWLVVAILLATAWNVGLGCNPIKLLPAKITTHNNLPSQWNLWTKMTVLVLH